MSERPLSPEGERLRRAIGAAGFEVTPSELAEAINEALERVRPGPDGCCTRCGRSGGGRDYRYGICDECAFCAMDDCDRMAVTFGPLTMCEAHSLEGERERDYLDTISKLRAENAKLERENERLRQLILVYLECWCDEVDDGPGPCDRCAALEGER